MQTAQALLILMAMATWAKHKELSREALAIQNLLATLARDDGFRTSPTTEGRSWEEWARAESVARTKFLIFCFFNLQSIVYNIPPLILNSELHMSLPCSAAMFRASNASEWRQRKMSQHASALFQDGLRCLYRRGGQKVTEHESSLGNYILIHGIVQHIFYVRQAAHCRLRATSTLTM